MPSADLLLATGEGLVRLLGPLERALETEESFAAFLRTFGWDVDQEGFDIAEVRSIIGVSGDLALAAQRLGEIVTASDGAPIDAYLELVEVVKRVVGSIRDLPGAPAPAGVPATAWQTFCADVLGELVVGYLERTRPAVLGLLVLGGVVDEHEVSAVEPGRLPYVRRGLRWDRLGALLRDPVAVAREAYGWGFGDSEGLNRLVQRTERALRLTGLPVDVAPPSAARLDRYYSPENPHRAEVREATISLLDAADADGNAIDATLGLLPIPPLGDPAGSPRGLNVAPTVQVSATPPLAVFWPFSLELEGPQAAYGGAHLELFPGSARVDLGSPADVSVHALARLRDDLPRTVLGSVFSSRLELREVSAALLVNGTLADPDIAVEVAVDKALLVVDLDQGDGFLAQVVGRGLKPVELSLALVWSSKSGLHLRTSGALEVIIPLQLDLGVAHIDSLTLRAEASTTSGVALSGGLSGRLALGPVQVALREVGAKASFVPVPRDRPPGTFGDLDLDFSFKPPNGAGLSIDAGAVTGGGYLSFDAKQEQYAGVLHLEFGQITLNAIGLLTTRLPDGSRGFSLLVIVQASGFTPVQLGFGFALTGVGGLLGINRTVAVDVLRAGVRTRALDSIMFMREDPVPRAPQIVSTLQSVFPPARGRFVFGPMVQLAWGTPALVTAEIALVLELPAPLRLIVLGRLRSLLPTPEAAVVKLQLDAVGVLDFDRREVSVDATLVDSTVGPFALSGDMALRASWGERPDFALSIGGFHPAYKPPPGFPALRRLTLALSSGDNPRLRAESYLAITANTVQVGAALELRVEAAGFALEGGMGFDALVTLSPFGFQVDIAAYLALKRGSRTLMGIDLRAHLTGPNPWHVNGEVTFKILFLKVTIRVDATFGDSRALPEVQRVAIWPKLKAALQTAGNWAAELPSDAGRLAVLQPPPPTAGEAIVHPLGTVRVTQRVVPLERTIARFGAAPPADYTRFTIASATGAKRDAAPLYESFSPAQFFDLSDAEKLAAPGFEPMPAGARFRAPENAQAVGPTAPCPLSYETIVDGGPAQGVSFEPETSTVGQQAEQGAAAGAETRNTGRLKYAVDAPPPKTADPAYGVAGIEVLKAAPEVETDGTYSAALEAARERRDLQIVRKEELVPA